MSKPKRAPAYQCHKSSRQARVKIDGRYHYIGKYGSEESIKNYHELISEWLTKNHEAELPDPIELQIDRIETRKPRRTRRRELKPDFRGNFRPYVGKHRGADGVLRPRKFGLGNNRDEAQKRYEQIRALYESVKGECWPENLLELADLIARGKSQRVENNGEAERKPVSGTPHFVVVNGVRYEIAKPPTPPEGASQMTLLEFYDRNYLTEKELTASTEQHYRAVYMVFNRWHGSPVRLCDLSDELVNSYLISLNGERAPKTIKNVRVVLLTLWRYAVEVGYLDKLPLRVRKVKCPRRLPDAFRAEELIGMIQAADQHDRYYPNGVRKGAFWACYIRVAFDTGLRLGDMLALPLDIPQEFRVIQHKTLDEIILRLNDSTMEALKEIRTPERELLFDWPLRREGFYEHWSKYVLQPAGIERNRRNGSQKVRRTAASYAEKMRAGAATALLGHRTADMARQHYIDPSIVFTRPPTPPDLGTIKAIEHKPAIEL